MYGLIRQGLAGAGTSATLRPAGLRARVRPNVLYLGLTSLFTDISSEMVTTVLPLYLLYALQLSILQFGVLDGLYQGSAALVQLASGLFADRFRRHKQVAAAGYAASAAARVGLVAGAASVPALGATLVADRLGKGVRTAPRDALISLSSAPEDLGLAFGVHRTLDTAGAFAGPLVAFALLALAPGDFRAVFLVSCCFAVVGLGVILLFVQGRPARAGGPRVSLREVLGLVGLPGYWRLLLVAAGFSLFTMSDGFLYVALQRRLSFGLGFFPLLYVGTSLFYMALALPAGRLADRLGRWRVFVAAHALLVLVYAGLLLPALGWIELVPVLALYGAFYAASDGVLAAAASALLPADRRTSGLAGLSTLVGACSLASSVVLGTLWAGLGVRASATVFGLGILVVGLAAGVAPAVRRESHG